MLTARMQRTTVLKIALPAARARPVRRGLVVDSQVGLIVCVVIGGLVLGVLNTVLTESVMEATDLPRSVASSSYSAVRFLGGAIAPPGAAALRRRDLAERGDVRGRRSVLVAVLIAFLGRKALRRVDSAHEESPLVEAEAITVGESL